MGIRRILVTALIVMACASALCLAGSTANAQDETALDRDLDKYWGEKREIRTIQKRLFMKETRFEFTLFGGVIPNDDFQVHYPLGGRAAYFFSEDIAAELSGAYTFRQESNLREFLTDQFEEGGGADAQIFIRQQIQWYAHADIIWSPFHGKVGLFTTKLFHFDFYIAAGVGVMGLEVDEPGADATAEAHYKVAGNVGCGVAAYMLDFLALRLDYRHFFHEFAGSGGGLSYPAELTLGVAFFTAAPE